MKIKIIEEKGENFKLSTVMSLIKGAMKFHGFKVMMEDDAKGIIKIGNRDGAYDK